MPQQRRAQATRRAILVAAAAEFDRNGYNGTPLSAILRRANVTKGAFYFHFASKQAVAIALIRRQGRWWPQLWRTWLQRKIDPLAAAVGMVDEATRLLEVDVLTRAGLGLAHDPEVFDGRSHGGLDRWEEWLSELLHRSADRGLLRSGVDPEAAARVVHAAMEGSRILGAADRPGPGGSVRMAEVWRVLLHGLASTEWLQANAEESARVPQS